MCEYALPASQTSTFGRAADLCTVVWIARKSLIVAKMVRPQIVFQKHAFVYIFVSCLFTIFQQGTDEPDSSSIAANKSGDEEESSVEGQKTSPVVDVYDFDNHEAKKVKIMLDSHPSISVPLYSSLYFIQCTKSKESFLELLCRF